ncbi:MAG: hypothetical protein WAU01_10815 [Saprospiraceae bacterium]
MKEDKFDEIIKKKMDDLLPMKETDVWSSFVDKLDQSDRPSVETADKIFDTKIKAASEGNRPKYNSNHWYLLKEQLTMIEERKNTIFISKVLEFAAVFLIVFTFFHISGVVIDKNDNTPLNTQSKYAVSDDRKENISNHMVVSQGSAAISASDIQPVLSQRKKPGVSLQNVNHLNSVDLIKTKLAFWDQAAAAENVIEPPQMATYTYDIGEDVNHLSAIDAVHTTDLILAQEKEKEVAQNVLTDEHIDANNGASIIDKSVTNHSTIDFLPRIPNTLVESEIPLMMPMKMVYPTTPARIAVSVYGSADINLINTPFDKLYSLASYNKEALNNSVGVNISRTTNQVEIETGLGYSSLVYQPKIIKEAFGQQSEYYFEKSLNKISYNIVNIPLNIKYHFINHDNWSSYLMVGATLNVVLNTDYDITETLRQGRPSAGRYTPDQARLTEKPFIKGFLNGDSFSENYFATVGFGFGIEKRVFKNTSLYIQPSYHRQFLSDDIGIGPNKDKIHTSSLQFGVKTVIN